MPLLIPRPCSTTSRRTGRLAELLSSLSSPDLQDPAFLLLGSEPRCLTLLLRALHTVGPQEILLNEEMECLLGLMSGEVIPYHSDFWTLFSPGRTKSW